MPDKDGFDAEQTVGAHHEAADPDGCTTLVIREIATGEPTAEALEGRISTLDRIIRDLQK